MNALTNLDALSRADRQAQIVHALSTVMPAHTLLYTLEDTVPYECDGLTAYRERPLVVALPETESQVQAVLKTCHAFGACGGPRCRDWFVGRRHAPQTGGHLVHGQVQSDSQDGPGV